MTPLYGPLSGGYTVTLNGFNLGTGNDITAATIGGVPQTVLGQTTTQVTLRVAPVTDNLKGTVVLYSASLGTITGVAPFQYAGRTFACGESGAKERGGGWSDHGAESGRRPDLVGG